MGLHAADLKPEKRLEAIRTALVEAAEKSNVRVSSSSWMDTHGALLQLNRFSSEIRLRDLQIDQYKKTTSTETVELSRKTTESIVPVRCDAPQARSPMKHVMRVSMDIDSRIPPSQQFLAQKNWLCRTATSSSCRYGITPLAFDYRFNIQPHLRAPL